MKKFAFYIALVGSLVLSCSEYPDAIEPDIDPVVDNPNVPDDEILKVKEIVAHYDIAVQGTYMGQNLDIPGTYEAHNLYNKAGESNLTGNLSLETPLLNSQITITHSSTLLAGNVAFKNTMNTYGNLLNEDINYTTVKEFSFQDGLASHLSYQNQQDNADITYTENSANIVNVLYTDGLPYRNEITINYNATGHIENATVRDRISEDTYQIIFDTANHQINQIRLEKDGESLGTLTFTYDNQINPFSLNAIEDTNTIQSIYVLIMAELTINPSKSPEENAMQMAYQMIPLSDFSTSNTQSILWNGDYIIQKSYEYNSKGYPTKVIIEEASEAWLSQILNLNLEAVSKINLNGTDTIIYY